VARLRLIVLAPLLVVGCEVFFGIKESSSSSAGSGGSGGAVTVPEAGADATSDHDAGSADAPPFCASMLADHFLCSDFDEPPLVPPWSDVTDGAADVALALDQGWLGVGSSPAIPPGPTNCEAGRVVAEIDGNFTGVHVDFDFSGCDGAFQGTAGSEDFLDINCVADVEGGTDTFGLVKWGLRPTGYGLDISAFDAAKGTSVSAPAITTPTPPAGTFTHVRLDVAFGDPGSVQLSIGGGAPVGSTSVNTSCPTKHQKALTLGIFGCKELIDCAVRFDNVVVDVTP
jgi:hypothetical protein